MIESHFFPWINYIRKSLSQSTLKNPERNKKKSSQSLTNPRRKGDQTSQTELHPDNKTITQRFDDDNNNNIKMQFCIILTGREPGARALSVWAIIDCIFIDVATFISRRRGWEGELDTTLVYLDQENIKFALNLHSRWNYIVLTFDWSLLGKFNSNCIKIKQKYFFQVQFIKG